MAFDWGNFGKVGMSGGLIPGVAAGLFGNNADPYGDASKIYGQIPGAISPYFNPYISAGSSSLPIMQQQFGDLVKDPGSVLGRFGQGYQQSPGFRFALQQALGGANNAAAAGGMLGSPQHQQQSADIASQMANKDFQTYLGNVLGLYQGGLQGFGGLSSLGAQSGKSLADAIAQVMSSQGNLSYEKGAAENKSNSDFWSGLGSIAGLAASLA